MGKYYVHSGDVRMIFDRKSIKQAAVDFILKSIKLNPDDLDDFVLVSERGFRVGNDFSEVAGDVSNCTLAPNEIAVFSAQQLFKEIGVN